MQFPYATGIEPIEISIDIEEWVLDEMAGISASTLPFCLALAVAR